MKYIGKNELDHYLRIVIKKDQFMKGNKWGSVPLISVLLSPFPFYTIIKLLIELFKNFFF